MQSAPEAARIVLLDNDPSILRLLVRMLAGLGYSHVTPFESAELALQHLTCPGPATDLLFLDINMPAMDGVEFIRRLAECRYTGGVIILSGESQRLLESVERLVRAQNLIGRGYLQKPVQRDQLRALLGRTKSHAAGCAIRDVSNPAHAVEQLRSALANRELINHYQPKVAVATREVIGVESLVRWQHPLRGLIFPDQFLPLMAEHGLLTSLTRVVLASAMEQAKTWREAGYPLQVAVNVSMDDIASLDFPDVAEALAGEIGIEPSVVTMEVTEGQVMKQLSTALDVLTRLRLKGFQLSMDDFGTGHSSLAQLRDLPFDELKLDRSFVHGAAANETLRAICSASLRMAQQLRLQVVAEGVEDQTDWDFLRSLGCDTAQGYFIARPMPAIGLPGWLASWDTH